MTETVGHPDIGARAWLALQKAGGLLGKAGFGVFLLAAAIAALVATTFIGLMLAIAAAFLAFSHGIGRQRRRNGDSSDTLDARHTADGWIIET